MGGGEVGVGGGGALGGGQGVPAGGRRGGGDGEVFRAVVWDWAIDKVGVARYTVEMETLGEGGTTRRLYRRFGKNGVLLVI